MPIVPGKPEESQVWKRHLRIPTLPSACRPRARASGRSPRRSRSSCGAGSRAAPKYEPHWSFVPPVRPPLPEVPDAHWVRDPLDRFVLARLEEHGIAPRPDADRGTLLRRVFLDLTGLPPTPAELESSSPTRARRLRALGRPSSRRGPYRTRYAEHLAAPWIDPSRYADTNGIHIDAGRQMWLWRDWVLGLRDGNALRPLRHRAGRRRSATRRDRGPEGRQRFQPQPRHDRRGRRDRRRVSGRVRGRPRRRRPARCSLASRLAAPAATTTSSTRSRRRTTTRCIAFFDSLDEPGL